ncbi:MAG: hypothetical protein KIT68_00020 [Phycisphaeraceae bacterium]|nr:hypothetical protein [Phycisphaeraceae bacterium]
MGSRSERAFAIKSLLGLAAAGGVLLATVGLAQGDPPRVPSTLSDFYFYGHQPRTPVFDENPLLRFDELVEPQNCRGCHGVYPEDPDHWEQFLPHARWSYSMMSQSYRDPIFLAQLQIAERDAGFSGDACLRCHAPMGWAQARNVPTSGAGLIASDKDGVGCSVCHRSVDPVERPFPSPPAGTPPLDGTLLGDQDRLVLEGLGIHRPPNFSNGGPVAANGIVLDNQDRRRGPFDLGTFFYHPFAQSPFHRTSQVCASCHDISNPIFTRQPGDTYVLNTLNTPHPTGNKYDMYPLDRLYSEWLMSAFAQGPVTLTVPDPNGDPGMVGRYSFDGVTRKYEPVLDPNTGEPVIDPNTGLPMVVLTDKLLIGSTRTSFSTCQDCHMPRMEATGCNPYLGQPTRPDVPVHNFAGVNSWVLRAVQALYPTESGLDIPALVDDSLARNLAMQRKALDLEVTQAGSQVRVRITNQTGHKLPSGFSEGRRMWINVRFLDGDGQLVAERGSYNAATATLTEADTKVYQAKQGLDAAMAVTAGLPLGPSFHLDLNNVMYFDNRIPPRGFDNAAFRAVQAGPVGYAYADGQYWDETLFDIPGGTRRVEVRVMHQTTSREYVEFLRTNAPDPSPAFVAPNPNTGQPIGQIAYNQWVAQGKSAPVEKALAVITVTSCPADIATSGSIDPNAGPDGFLTGEDFDLFIEVFFTGFVNNQGRLLADIATVGSSNPYSGPDGFLTGEDFDAFIQLFFTNCGQ